jgi:hypothetical protein
LHALSVTGPSGVSYSILANNGNPCADGQLFPDPSADGNFIAVPDQDLVYLLTVT